jgi:hypothetical protein
MNKSFVLNTTSVKKTRTIVDIGSEYNLYTITAILHNIIIQFLVELC